MLRKHVGHFETRFFSELLENQSTVTVYLRHGIKLTGTLVGVSEEAIFLGGPMPQMIYKDSISTVIEVA